MNALRAAPWEAWSWKTLGETPGVFFDQGVERDFEGCGEVVIVPVDVDRGRSGVLGLGGLAALDAAGSLFGGLLAQAHGDAHRGVHGAGEGRLEE